ncbi:MAG: RHS repeat domain-containing protein [Verrucomicrobiota bacterium]
MKRSILTVALLLSAALFLGRPLRAENVRYSYDDAGRLTGVYYPNGRTIQYFYDGAGNLLRQLRTSITDSDSDGLDDAWETTHFGSLARDGSGDFDSDGVTDLHEFMAGTNPNDNASLLQVTEASSTAGVSFTIQWASIPGKAYRVQYTDSLDPVNWKNLGGDVTATGATSSKTDPNVTANTRRFYRVVALF